MLKFKSEPKQVTFDDFTKLIAPHTEIVIIVPWNGQPVPVTIRMLDSITLNACGEFNTVQAVLDSGDEKAIDNEIIIKTKNIHENILRHALVHPTFIELEEWLKNKDFYLQAHARSAEIRELIKTLPSATERAVYEKELDLLELSTAFLLPEDFTATIVTIIMQKEATDINKLNRDTLLRVGLLAERYNVRPSSYLDGTFTAKQNEDIDMAAISAVHEYREMQKADKGKMKWIRGGAKEVPN